MSSRFLVITSWPDLDGAKAQARDWIEQKLAASVNILPAMDSIYRWRGELREGREHKIFIKTHESRLDELRRRIRAAHPYETAEILCFEIDSGDQDYFDWIDASTR